MRFLVDNALSPRLAAALLDLGYDATHVRSLGMQSHSDDAIFDFAIQESRTVVTADTDFTAIAVRSARRLPSILLLRLQPSTVDEDIEFVVRTIEQAKVDIESGSLVSIRRNGVRVRKLPLRP